MAHKFAKINARYKFERLKIAILIVGLRYIHVHVHVLREYTYRRCLCSELFIKSVGESTNQRITTYCNHTTIQCLVINKRVITHIINQGNESMCIHVCIIPYV